MRHAVAFTHGYGVVVKGVEVNRHAERSADFVLTAVTFADACAFVVRAGKVLLKHTVNFRRFVAKLFLLQRKHRNLIRRESVMQMQNNTGIAVDFFLVIGV